MFIRECAKFLYEKYGERISDLNILLPSRRATLFFNMELSKLLQDTPIWQPKFLSPNNIFSSLSGIEQADRLKLLVVLYKVYSSHHSEPFDKFYYWGDMILSDFDSIDNYMVDAEKLYSNSADIRDIEERFDYMPEEDIEEINRFWKHFRESRNSEEKNYFFNIWRTLYPIYKEFKEALLKENIGYNGMIYRKVAEDIISGKETINSEDKYAVIGFNALSTTEKILFDTLKERCGADFIWDSDNSYITNKESEAGIFIRSNILRYGESAPNIARDNYLKQKEITIVNSPSSSVECKYVWEYLDACNERASAKGKKLGAETAIILTDESLLLPVLYSIPPYIEHFNVTAGYELRLTEAYSLCESIISLQTNCKTENGIEFYHKDVLNIISHPLIEANLTNNEKEHFDEIIVENLIYYPVSKLQKGDFSSLLFSPVRGWNNLCDYLLYILGESLSNIGSDNHTVKEAIFRTHNTIKSLKEQISITEIELNDLVFLSLLRKHLKSERISFEGEPLVGIQIMGILESRNIDFENVLLLSVGEDNFPSKNIGSSFIPSNLRHGYGLPTSNHHQSMYSYYFYRLIQRAEHIYISYVSASDEMGSGEPSRYIHQLIYSGEHKINQLHLTLDITTTDAATTILKKEGLIKEYITKLSIGEKRLSASSLYNYIQCPMKFYYSNIEGLRDETKEREIEVGAIEMGDIMHLTLQDIYSSLISLSNDEIKARLRAIKLKQIEEEVSKHLSRIIGIEPNNFDSKVRNNIKFITSYILSVINYDINRNDGFTILGIEKGINGTVSVNDAHIRFYGLIDRLDLTSSGSVKIIDYKSGSERECKSIFSLFDTEGGEHNKPVMQSLLYAMLYSAENPYDVIPNLYHVRTMNKKDFSPLISIKSMGLISHYNQIALEFEAELKEKLKELLDIDIPIYKCDNTKVCNYCDYADLCNI